MARFTYVRVFAPAKVNLTLHVTGQRADGYHLLDSLVAFADVGDELVLSRSGPETLVLQGPEARHLPADGNNLVARTAALFDDMQDIRFSLTKNLPVASGIGGGSADAAAAFRGLMACRHGQEVEAALCASAVGPLGAELLRLGADIPMCLMSAAARVSGIGDQITPLPQLPPLQAVLVNPRCGVSTAAVFRALASRDNAAMEQELPQFLDAADLTGWLAAQRNDMEAAALSLEPAIAMVTSALQGNPQCRLARMSGSGATCFGLYDTWEAAEEAAENLRHQHPGWWVRATQLGSQSERALPRFR